MAAMPAYDVLDDRETEPGAAQLARARRVDPEEPLGHPRQVFTRDPRPVVLDHDPEARAAAQRTGAVRCGRQVLAGDLDRPPSPPYLIALSARFVISWIS